MKALRRLTLIVGFAFLFAPMVTIAIFSFYKDSYLTFPPRGWTTDWYGWLFTKGEFLASLKTSLLLGATATALSTLFGVPAAFALVRGRFVGRGILEGILLSPLILPAVIFGVGLLLFFSSLKIRPDFTTLVIGHLVITIPFVTRNVMVSITGIPSHVEEAALGLGAPPWRTFLRVVLPLIMPGIGAGAMLAFLISFDELAMTIFISSPSTVTLPLRIFTYVEWHLDPGIAALSTMLTLATVGLLVAMDRLRGPEHLF